MKGGIALSALIFIVVALMAPLAGSTHIDFAKAFSGVSPDHEIFFYARLPRVLLALLAGAALSITGVLFQCMLRDPLAEPYTLGVSSGASVERSAICLGFHSTGIASLIGAALVLLIVVGMSLDGRRMSSFTLLLTGVTMNSIAFAVILFLHSVASFAQSFAISRWLMGGLDAVPYSTLGWLAAIVVPVLIAVTWRAPQWNLIAVGEEWAASRGVSTAAFTAFGYIAGSVLTGLVTSLTGPIGFVGLIVPHALRLKFSADHRVLMPCSILLGAAFLVICDTLARTMNPPTDIPVGVLTAMGGGPFFSVAASLQAEEFVDVVRWPLQGAVLGAAGAAVFYYTNAPLLVVLLWAAAAFVLREPRVSGVVGAALVIVAAGASSQLFPSLDAGHWAETLVASQILPRAAMGVLAWIARPAADVPALGITSGGAIFAIAVGMVAAFLAGWPALLLMAASLLVIRVVLGWSYRSMGGISLDSLGWVRQVLEVLVLLIASLPASSLYSGAR